MWISGESGVCGLVHESGVFSSQCVLQIFIGVLQ